MKKEERLGIHNQQEFWLKYYSNLAKEPVRWLDYSNERVQAQTFALALEAAGPIYDRSCLDIGCGNGQFSICLKALQASEVTGVDLIDRFIQENQTKYPEISWVCGDVATPSFYQSLGSFDLMFLLEVLQYVPIAETIHNLWEHLAPDGRLIGMVPNQHCPIVRKAVNRFDSNYIPAETHELKALFQALPQVDCWCIRGLHFHDDQRILPYQPSWWTTDPNRASPTNRLQFVLKKI